MESKFKIGDKVIFVNDYEVVFNSERTITEIEITKDSVMYQVEPNDTPWALKHERNLHLVGTYEAPNQNLELNDGTIAVFCKYTDGVELLKIYKIKEKGKETLYCVLLDGLLYSMTIFEEPIEPLKKTKQIKG